MAVLVQEEVHADYSFIVHTKDPTEKEGRIYAEIAVGLGETLCSGNQQGTPYRLQITRVLGDVDCKAFANYSFGVISGKKDLQRIDYTKTISADPSTLDKVGKTLAKIGVTLEEAYNGIAQDIEGTINV